MEDRKRRQNGCLPIRLFILYGLNDRIGDECTAEKPSRVFGNKFLPMHRLCKSPEYNYSKIKLDNSFLK